MIYSMITLWVIVLILLIAELRRIRLVKNFITAVKDLKTEVNSLIKLNGEVIENNKKWSEAIDKIDKLVRTKLNDKK